MEKVKVFTVLGNTNFQKFSIKSVVNHGDYAPKHLIVGGGKIICVLDFGEVQGNYWGYDLIRWDYWFGDYIGIEALRRGYGENNFDDQFKELSRLLGLKIALDTAWWYLENDYKEGVVQSIERAERYLFY